MTTNRVRGTCPCGNPASSNGFVAGRRTFKRVCVSCHREAAHRKFKRDKCERCGFVPEWLGQLDVDHIDGNHSNNDVSNLQTLCANCHRLKTWKETEQSRDIAIARLREFDA